MNLSEEKISKNEIKETVDDIPADLIKANLDTTIEILFILFDKRWT